MNDPSASKDVDKGEPLHIIDKNTNQYSHSKKRKKTPKKLKIELAYDPAFPLLNIHPKEMKLMCQRHQNFHIYWSTIHNSQEMETM